MLALMEEIVNTRVLGVRRGRHRVPWKQIEGGVALSKEGIVLSGKSRRLNRE